MHCAPYFEELEEEDFGREEKLTEERGCGSREQGGLYMCMPLSENGFPIEHFLVDPSVEWKSDTNLRAPMLISDVDGVFHVVLGVGKKFYPTVSDFVEEARRMGVSKRIPRDFDFSKLTPTKSKLLLVHPRAIQEFSYEVDSKERYCPRKIKMISQGKVQEGDEVYVSSHLCLGDLWSLGSLMNIKTKHETSMFDDHVQIKTPSVSYSVAPCTPLSKDEREPSYCNGIFMQLPRWRFEYVNRNKRVPKEFLRRLRKLVLSWSVYQNDEKEVSQKCENKFL